MALAHRTTARLGDTWRPRPSRPSTLTPTPQLLLRMADGEVTDWRPDTGPTPRELQQLDREVPALLREFAVIEMALTDPCPLSRRRRRIGGPNPTTTAHAAGDRPDPTTGPTPADS